MFVDCIFEFMLKDPASRRLQLPIRVTAEDALTLGDFEETCEERRRHFADYHLRAFNSIDRFGRASCGLSVSVADERKVVSGGGAR